MQYLDAVSKNNRMIFFHFQSKPFNVIVTKFMSQPLCQRSWSWTVLWRPTTPSRNDTKKDVLFIIGNWNAKVGSQEILGVIGKFGFGVQNDAGQRLTELCWEHTSHNKHLPTTQEKTVHMDITGWSTLKSEWLYSLQPKMEQLYTVSKNKTDCWLWLRSWILIVKFRLKLKKVSKTTRPFRYDLNQIPYDYTVDVTNRFKGLDRVREELWMEVCDIVQQAVIKTTPKKKKW